MELGKLYKEQEKKEGGACCHYVKFSVLTHPNRVEQKQSKVIKTAQIYNWWHVEQPGSAVHASLSETNEVDVTETIAM